MAQIHSCRVAEPMGRVSNTDAPPLRFRNDEDFCLYRPAGRPLPVRFAPPQRKFRRIRRAKRRVATLSLRELPVKAGQEAMPVALAARDTIVRALSRCADSAGQSRPLAKRDVRSIFSAKMRRGGRVVEGARLESVYAGNRIAGSNPAPPSATTAYGRILARDLRPQSDGTTPKQGRSKARPAPELSKKLDISGFEEPRLS